MKILLMVASQLFHNNTHVKGLSASNLWYFWQVPSTDNNKCKYIFQKVQPIKTFYISKYLLYLHRSSHLVNLSKIYCEFSFNKDPK